MHQQRLRHTMLFIKLPSHISLNVKNSHVTFRAFATAVQGGPIITPSANIPNFAPPAFNEKNATFEMKTYKPRTPGLRHLRRPINFHLWKGRPFLPLTFTKKGHGKGGRNNTGRVTVRHMGGGHKTRIRTVDFKRATPGPHTVERIEHDPGRSAHIALLNEEATGRKSYILAAEGMRSGDVVQSYLAGIPKDLLDSMGGVVDPGVLAAKTAWRGNCLPLHMIPVGTIIYNVGSRKGHGAVFCRSAGTYAVIVSKSDETKSDGKKFVVVRLQSGEVRRVSRDACATIGVASNPHHQYAQLGKAGRSRWLNIRPTVRGVAMNAADHPHGGGRGKSKGNVNPVSPWGLPAKGGYKTRRVRNPNKWVVVPKVRNQGKRREC
ncbi:BgTH12-05559 [Blumeria graminis f. sp. triticale]|uniref:Large ribosomal subunit protein uL2m n=1 Tax=Blumeria graminis f. sp. triticale TaxID=1689686 RepID=A0A9W4GFP5_BLUGR|nr:BgTH12-05559 [Blumeria graminis f. sp. triticale]